MSFNPELIGTEEGRAELAQDIATTLDADTTEPTPHRDNWVGEKDLRTLESVVVQGQERYSEYARVCETARGFATNPTVRTLFLLGHINGLRRLPEGERPDDQLRLLFEQAREEIEDLPESARKGRLLSLWSYHAGIYARVVGNYRLAAESQTRSAELAEAAGDQNGAAISRFCEAVERVNLALVEDPSIVGASLSNLSAWGGRIEEILTDKTDPTSRRWLFLNAPIHLLTAHFWGGETYPESKHAPANFLVLEKLDPDLARTHESTIAVAWAIAEWGIGATSFTSATELAHKVVEGHAGAPPSPEYMATAHLLLGKIAEKRAEGDRHNPTHFSVDIEEARRHYRAALNVEGSAHQVRAVAKRLLDRLSTPSASSGDPTDTSNTGETDPSHSPD